LESPDINVKKTYYPFIILLFCYALYAGIFIYRTSFIVNEVRYFCLLDDAMISMTYARNLAAGCGLVWNAGEPPVEGITNLLWALYMALFHLLPIAVEKISLCIQVSGALLLLANIITIKKIADILSDGNIFISFGAALLTAFYLPLNNWALQGTEVGALTFLTSLTVLKIIQNYKGSRRSLSPFILLGIAALIRIDMFLLYGTVLIFLFFAEPQNRRFNAFAGLGVFVISLLSQTLFRRWYYGDIFPNTYYLKMSGIPLGLRLMRGLLVLALFIWKMNWCIAMLSLIFIFHKRAQNTLLLYLLIAAQMFYSIYIGGDSWEWWGGSNRFISIVMPLFFILICQGAHEIIVDKLKRGYLIYSLLILAILANLNATRGAAALADALLIKRPLHVIDNQQKIQTALEIKKITTPDAHAAVAWAGIPIYFSERKGVDLLGKNDPVIARQPMKPISGIREFNPGHLKRDYNYSIGVLRPDVVVELARHPEKAKRILNEFYENKSVGEFEFYFLKNSDKIIKMKP